MKQSRFTEAQIVAILREAVAFLMNEPPLFQAHRRLYGALVVMGDRQGELSGTIFPSGSHAPHRKLCSAMSGGSSLSRRTLL